MAEPSIPLSELVGDDRPRTVVSCLRDDAAQFPPTSPMRALLYRIADAIEAHAPAEPPEGTTHLIDKHGELWESGCGDWLPVNVGATAPYAEIVRKCGPVQHLRLLDGEDGS